MGIIHCAGDTVFVLEAVQPVQLTDIDTWIEKGLGGRYVVKRLKNADKLLTRDVISRMQQIGAGYIGKDYDPYFEWSDERIYCSELVWKIYKRVLNLEIGGLQRIGDFELSHAAVKEKLRERFGDHVPEEEPAISPAQMFSSELLITVCSR